MGEIGGVSILEISTGFSSLEGERFGSGLVVVVVVFGDALMDKTGFSFSSSADSVIPFSSNFNGDLSSVSDSPPLVKSFISNSSAMEQ